MTTVPDPPWDFVNTFDALVCSSCGSGCLTRRGRDAGAIFHSPATHAYVRPRCHECCPNEKDLSHWRMHWHKDVTGRVYWSKKAGYGDTSQKE
jgi:hypothetical protein